MKFAVISDLHGNLAACQAVFDELDQMEEPVDFVACTGNVVGYGPHPNEVIQILRDRDVQAIRGNYDEAVSGRRFSSGVDLSVPAQEREERKVLTWIENELTPESLQYLKALPGDRRFEASRSGRVMAGIKESESEAAQARKGVLANMFFGTALLNSTKRPSRFEPKKVLFVHGSPRDTVENLYFDTAQSILRTISGRAKADVIFHGHTYDMYQRQVDNVAFVGVGAVGWPQSKGEATYVLAEFVDHELAIEFRTVDYDAETEARAAERAGFPPDAVARLRWGNDRSVESSSA